MAVELIKSAALTAADSPASQTVSNQASARVASGRVKESVGTGEFTSTASIASIARLARVPSNARISQILLSCDAITSAAADIGIYDVPTVNSGAAVDVDFFASAQSLASALVNSDVTHEADAADAGAGFGQADVEKPLWQALGLTADPGKLYDVAITLTAAATAAGTVSLKTRFVDGN